MRLARLPIAFCALALLAACSRDGSGPEAAPQTTAAPAPVRTAPVEEARVDAGVRAVGVLAPRDELRLSFKVGGIVERMAVDAGDRVAAGQVLATLKRAEVDAAVAQAAEAAEKSRRDLERARQLRVDEALSAAEFNARYSSIVAPAAGVVQQRLARAGELVQGGQPVLVLGATGSGWVVRAALADRDAVRVNVGDVAEVSFDAFPGRRYAGRVSRVGSSADPQTGTFEVEVEVEPAGARFVRGLVGKLRLTPGGDGATIRAVVPVTAIVEADGPDAIVYVHDAAAGIAQRRPVKVGSIVGERVVVLDGLAPGERVVTDGAAWLTDGRAVRVVSDSGTAAGPG